ncbi:MAG: Gfo/Idh/MocA family protein [Planctomycetota bacterium]|jgi:predicted dehydrogenase
MDSEIYRGAIVGFGRMGLTHFSILNAHPRVSLVAVCDSSSFILKNVSRLMDIKTYSNVDEMLNATACDFAIVATPTSDHDRTVRRAVEKGLHVFVEKPFTLLTRQGQEILRLLRDKPLANQVGYVLRFSDIFMQVREILCNKVIGDLLNFKMEMHGPTMLHRARSGWRSKKNEGGGCLCDFASHAIDLINYLVGTPDSIEGTVFQSIYSEGVEDAIGSTFLYKSGVRGTLLVNWSDPSYRKPTHNFEAFGRKGRIIANRHEYRLFLQPRFSCNGFSEGWNHRYATDCFQPVDFYLRGYEFTRQLEHFIDCISQGRPSDVCSFEQACQTDMVIEQLRQDAERRHFSDGIGQNYLR